MVTFRIIDPNHRDPPLYLRIPAQIHQLKRLACNPEVHRLGLVLRTRECVGPALCIQM